MITVVELHYNYIIIIIILMFQCLPHFWYVSIEFQLTLVGIFVIIFAFNRKKHALKAFILLILIGLIASGYVAFLKRINIAVPIFEKAILL